MSVFNRKYGPNYVYLVILLIGIVFFMFLFNLVGHIADSKKGDYVTIKMVVKLFFLVGAAIAFFEIISFKTILLTDETLLISNPLILKKTIIEVKEIKSIAEKSETINISSSAFRQDYFSIGKITVLTLSDSRKIKLNSLNIGNYDDLVNKIKHLQHR